MGIDAEMFVRHSGFLSDVEIRKLAGEMCSRFGTEQFYMNRVRDRWSSAHHALAAVSGWSQDGPDIEPEDGEQFIRVYLMSWYYGPGYERGDWMHIRGVAEFLQHRIPGSQVWYGGDSSGVCAEPLTPEKIAELNKLWLDSGNTPYRIGFGGLFETGERPVCEFCGGRPFINSGGGGDRTFYWCDGCGEKRVVTRLGSYILPEGTDFFNFDEKVSTPITQ